MEALKALEASVRETDALVSGEPMPQTEEQQQQQAQAEAMALGAEWAVIPQMIGGALCMAMPELAPVYSEKACLKWGEAMAPVAIKRGWDKPDSLPEFHLALASLAFVVPTVMVVRQRIKASAKAKAEGDAENDAAGPGAADGGGRGGAE